MGTQKFYADADVKIVVENVYNGYARKMYENEKYNGMYNIAVWRKNNKFVGQKGYIKAGNGDVFKGEYVLNPKTGKASPFPRANDGDGFSNATFESAWSLLFTHPRTKMIGRGAIGTASGISKMSAAVALGTSSTALEIAPVAGTSADIAIKVAAASMFAHGSGDVSKGIDAIEKGFLGESGEPKNYIEEIYKKVPGGEEAFFYVDNAMNAYCIVEGIASMKKYVKNGGNIYDETFTVKNAKGDLVQDLAKKALVRETIASNPSLEIVGQRGKSSFIVLQKEITNKNLFDWITWVSGTKDMIELGK